MSSDDVGLSADEFRARLCENLKSYGFVDLIKSQIRTKLIAELSRDGGSKLFMGRINKKSGSTLVQRAVDSLVAHHLISSNYDYTLSIFIPESGMDQKNLLSVRDILQILNISPEFIGGNQKGGPLHELIEVLLAKKRTSWQVETQTEDVHLSLEAKLLQVESFYRRLEGKEGTVGVDEEKMDVVRRMMEEKMKSDFELKISRFRKKELSSVRREERDKARQEVEKYKQELDRIYQERLQSVIRREDNLNISAKEKETSLEKESFRQRQSLLDEISRLKEREELVKRKEEEIQRDKKLMGDKFSSFEEMMKRREEEVEEARKGVEDRVWSEIHRFKMEVEKDYQERLNAVKTREEALEDKEMNFEAQRTRLDSLQRDVIGRDELLMRAENEVQELRTSLQEYKRIHDKDQEIMLKLKKSCDDLNSTKQELIETKGHLARVLKESALDKQELSERLSRLTGEGELESRSLREQNKQLRESLELVQEMTDKMTRSFQMQLNKETSTNKELQMKLNSLVAQQKMIYNDSLARGPGGWGDNADKNRRTAKKRSKSKRRDDDDDDDTSTLSSTSGNDVIRDARRRLERLTDKSEKLESSVQRILLPGSKFMTSHSDETRDSQQDPIIVHGKQPVPFTNERINNSRNRTFPNPPSGKMLAVPSKMPSNLKHRELDRQFFHNYTDKQISTLANLPTNDPELSVTFLRKQMSKEIEKYSSNFLPQNLLPVHQDQQSLKYQSSDQSSVVNRLVNQVDSKFSVPDSVPEVARPLNRSIVSTQQVANFSNNSLRDVLHLERNASSEFSTQIRIRSGTAELLPKPLEESNFESPKVEGYEHGNGVSTFRAANEKDGRSSQNDYRERVQSPKTDVADDLKTASTKGDDHLIEKPSKREASDGDLVESETNVKDANEKDVDDGRKITEVEKYLELMKSVSVEKKSSREGSSTSESGSISSGDYSSSDSSISRGGHRSDNKVPEKLLAPLTKSDDEEDDGSGW